MVKAAFREDTAVAAGAASVTALAWRHRGVLRVTVIAKATFAFAIDAVMPRVEPQPIFRAEVNHGNNPTRTTRFAADLAPYLERAEILFTGHAYPPGGHPLETMPVRLGVFSGGEAILDKMLILRQPGGFRRMPLVYERAYGGIGWPDNPLGVGALAGSGTPTIFDPRDGERVAGPDGGPPRPSGPAGFGPIGAAWAARRKLLGSVPRKALDRGFVELPDDFDFGYFQAAPADQRIPFLRGDEWIVMDGLHPTVPRTRMRLPGARGLALVYGLVPWGVAEGQPLALHADTLRIDGDDLRCTLTFRGVFPVAADEALAGLRVVAGVEMPGEPIAWPSAEEMARRAPAPESETPSLEIHGSVSISLSLSGEDFESVRGNVLDGTLALGPDEPKAAPEQALPFQPGPAPAAIAQGGSASSEQKRKKLGATLPIDVLPDFGPVMPFRPVSVPAPVIGHPHPPETPKPPAPPVPEARSSAPAAQEKKLEGASPWAPAPAPAPRAPAPPPPPQGPPPATPKLKKGLYGKFGGGK